MNIKEIIRHLQIILLSLPGIFSAPLLLGGVGGGLLSSCTDEVDDYFEQSASARLSSTLDHARQVLRSAEYGWELEYYPGSGLDYGGLVYTIRFDSLTATVGCSLIADSTVTSYYRLTNDNGPVLTFDTYNELLHYFSTPSSSEYEAKGGEFEFVIDSIGDDLISLYGKKTRNTMYLRRLTQSPDAYAQRTITIFDHFVDSITGSIDGKKIVAKCYPTARNMNVICERDTFDVSYAYTDHGIRFYRPVSFGGTLLQSFDFDVETNQLTCSDAGKENITLQGIPFASTFMNFSRYEGDYSLAYSTESSVDVHLKANRLEGTYLLQGLSPKYDLVLHYDQESGDLKLGAQIVGEIDGRTVYWSCVTYASGSISNLAITDEGQFTIHWNGNRFYPRFNFSATNPNLQDCNSGLLIYVYYNEQGNLTAGLVNDPDWLTNGSYLLGNLKSLNRKGRME